MRIFFLFFSVFVRGFSLLRPFIHHDHRRKNHFVLSKMRRVEKREEEEGVSVQRVLGSADPCLTRSGAAQLVCAVPCGLRKACAHRTCLAKGAKRGFAWGDGSCARARGVEHERRGGMVEGRATRDVSE